MFLRIFSPLIPKQSISVVSYQKCLYSFKRSDTPDPDPELRKKWLKPKHTGDTIMERPTFPGEFDAEFPPKGKIYDNKPFKMTLEAGKKYAWCTCGHSKSQPLCDGQHKQIAERYLEKKRPVFKPHRFTVEETKDYYLCNCKQTNNRPFCDGTHRRQDIQDAIKE